MPDMTPLEEAEAFLGALDLDAPPAAWIGKAWGADGSPRYLTYGTVRALVEQIKLDEQRLADAAKGGDGLAATIAEKDAYIVRLQVAVEIAENLYAQGRSEAIRELAEEIRLARRHPLHLVPGVHDTCTVCNGLCDYYRETGANGDIVNRWMHRMPPADGHDAQFEDLS